MDEQNTAVTAERIAALMASGDLDGMTALYHDDAVVDWPQSGERVVGRENIREMLRSYPGGTPAPTVRAVHSAGDLAVAETLVTYPDGSRWHTAEIFQFRDGKVAYEAAYFGQTFQAPEWRAKWVRSIDKEGP